MPYQDKGTKAKTLATASTLQKVVCPAPEMDPQEILSNGWRKVGEQKRYTNRLTYGNPNLGYKLSIHERAKLPSQPTGRQVLERMFGHLRPRRNIMSADMAKLKAEEAELANGLSSQAANAAYYRPSIAAALKPLPPEFNLPDTSGAAAERPAQNTQRHLHFANVDDPTQPNAYRKDPEISAVDGCAVGEDKSREGCRSQRSSPASSPGGTPQRVPLHQRAAPGGSLKRHGSDGNDFRRQGKGHSGPEHAGALPVVVCRARAGGMSYSALSQQFQQHFQLAQIHDKGSPQGPAVSAPNVPYTKRRASVSGDLPLPAITVSSYGTGSATARAGSCSGSAGPAGPSKHVVLTLGFDSTDPAGSDVGVPPQLVLPVPRSKHDRHDRNSYSGAVGSANGVVVSGSASSMPHLGHRPHLVAAAAATGLRMCSDDGSMRRSGSGRMDPPPPPPADASGGRWSPLPVLMSMIDGTPAAMAALTKAASWSRHTTGAGDSSAAGDIGGGSNFGTSASGSGVAGTPTASSAHASMSGVPLSGLEKLSATGLADAIEQLRHIRTRASVAQTKEPRDRKHEPGLAGIMPVQLMPVPLPPLETWSTTGRLNTELDPCRGIRLVDTTNYVLPRQHVENSLQHRMAQNQAAMVQLVKAEGRPMSETEMEAVRLLGRLERSGARQRNYGDVDEDEEADGEDLER